MVEPRYVVNVEVAVAWRSQYLMTVRGAAEDHAAGTLSVPGGKVEDVAQVDDVLEATARRELREETGLVAGDRVAYVESHVFVLDDGTPVVDVVFLCALDGEPVLTLATDEVAEATWMTADEVERHPLAPAWTRRSVQLAERRRRELGW